LLSAEPSADLVVAICDEGYRAAYRGAYLKEHHALLVLLVKREPPSRWPKGPWNASLRHGPVHDFSPEVHTGLQDSFAHRRSANPVGSRAARVPQREDVFSALAPRGPDADDVSVQAGYKIAQQNCFRSHNSGRESEQKSGRPWLVLSAFASAAPAYFSTYVRDPKKENTQAQMPGNPGYDDATLRALPDYFGTFVPEKR